MKSIINFAVIVILVLAAIGLPINSFVPGDSVSNVSIEESEFTLSASSDNVLNPTKINVKLSSTGKDLIALSNSNVFKLRAFSDDKIVFENEFVKASDFDSNLIEIDSETPYETSIDISQDMLGIQNGRYKLQLSLISDAEKYLNAGAEFEVEFANNTMYLMSTNKAPSGSMGLTLYFPDTNFNLNQLVGVTRFVPKNAKTLSTKISELQKGPIEGLSGIHAAPVIGNINYISTKGDLIYIDMPSSETVYTADPMSAHAAMNSFVRSIGGMKGKRGIQFLVDYKKSDTFFVDQDVSQVSSFDSNNRAYLAFYTGGRYYLVDANVNGIEETDTIENKAKKIFEVLRSGDSKLWATMPHDVTLNAVSLEGSTLTLDFSSEITTVFKNFSNLEALMLDSILYSFTSIPGVDHIKIYSNGTPVNSLAGIDTSQALIRPIFINPEQ